jgi:CheY-like chemotaxis protein
VRVCCRSSAISWPTPSSSPRSEPSRSRPGPKRVRGGEDRVAIESRGHRPGRSRRGGGAHLLAVRAGRCLLAPAWRPRSWPSCRAAGWPCHGRRYQRWKRRPGEGLALHRAHRSALAIDLALSPLPTGRQQAAMPSRPSASREILCVDDNATQPLRPIGAMLRAAGHSATSAVRGRGAGNPAPGASSTLCMLDMVMPEMDGLDDPCPSADEGGGPNARTPVIACTANVLPDQVASLREGRNGGRPGQADRSARPCYEAI